MPGVTRYKVLCQEVDPGLDINLRDNSTVLGITESLGVYRVWYLVPMKAKHEYKDFWEATDAEESSGKA